MGNAHRKATTAILGAAAATAALAFGGCTLKDSGEDLAAGKQAFVESCGSCHTLARAGTQGTSGPNLDAAFKRSLQDGFNRDTVEGIVHQQILHPGRTGVMVTADLPEGEVAEDIAAYVAFAVARPGEDSGALAGTGAPEVEEGADPATVGKQIFTASGCGGCHVLADAGTSGSTGPNLDESLAGKDAEYILQGIVEPDAVLASGFQAGIMPGNYGEQLSEEQLDALVQYLTGLVGG